MKSPRYVLLIVCLYLTSIIPLQALLLDDNDIKGTYDCVNPEDQIYSPFNGWVWAKGGVTEKFYRFGPLETTKDKNGVVTQIGNGDATIKLTYMLFHAVLNDFRPTHEPSQAASYWDAAFIGTLLNEIRKALENNIDTDLLKTHIEEMLTKQIEVKTKKDVSLEDVTKILEPIKISIQTEDGEKSIPPSQALLYLHKLLKDCGFDATDGQSLEKIQPLIKRFAPKKISINHPEMRAWLGIGIDPNNPKDVLKWLIRIASIKQEGRALLGKLEFFDDPKRHSKEEEPFITLEQTFWKICKDKTEYKKDMQAEIEGKSLELLHSLFEKTGIDKESIKEMPLSKMLGLDIDHNNKEDVKQWLTNLRDEMKKKSFSDIFHLLHMPDSVLKDKPLVRLRNTLWNYYKQLSKTTRELKASMENKKTRDNKALQQVPDLARIIVQAYQEAGQFLPKESVEKIEKIEEKKQVPQYEKKYPLHTPTMIILSFLIFKIEKKEDLKKYLEAFNPTILTNNYEEIFEEKFSDISEVNFTNFIDNDEIKVQDYETICFTLIKGKNLGEKIPHILKHIDHLMPKKSHEDKEIQSADCGETAVLNFVRILLAILGCVSQDEKYFDLSQLPQKMLLLFKKNEKKITQNDVKQRIKNLTDFFFQEKIKNLTIDSNDTFLHQHWTDTIISNLPEVKYLRGFYAEKGDRKIRQRDFSKPFVHSTGPSLKYGTHKIEQLSKDYFLYEVAGYPSTYVEIVNYLFGTTFKTFKEMCDFFGISSSHNLDNLTDDNVYNKQFFGFVPFKCSIDGTKTLFSIAFSFGHTEITAAMDKKPSKEVQKFFIEPYKKTLEKSLFKGKHKHDFRLQNILASFPTCFSYIDLMFEKSSKKPTIAVWQTEKKSNKIDFFNTTMRYLCLIQDPFPTELFSGINVIFQWACIEVERLKTNVSKKSTIDLDAFLTFFAIKHIENFLLLHPENEASIYSLIKPNNFEYIFNYFISSSYSKNIKYIAFNIFTKKIDDSFFENIDIYDVIKFFYTLVKESEKENGFYSNIFEEFISYTIFNIIDSDNKKKLKKYFCTKQHQLNDAGKLLFYIHVKYINPINKNWVFLDELKNNLQVFFSDKINKEEKKLLKKTK